MNSRTSPVVEVSDEDLAEFSDVQLGSRVLAALAHTPAEGLGSYHAILVANDREAVSMTPEDVADAQYDTIIQHKLSITDEWRETVGEIVRRNLESNDSFILGRS